MKPKQMESRGKLLEEYVGDGDRAFRLKGSEFPLIFLSNRFTHIGWDGYLIGNLEEYQKCLFNDEFTSLTPAFNAENLRIAKEKSKELLTKEMQKKD